MGLFKKKPAMTDRIWLNADLKLQDIVSMVRKTMDNNQIPLCIFHFRDTGKTIKTELESKGYRVHSIQSIGELQGFSPEGWRSRTDIIFMKSDGITRSDISSKVKRGQQVAFVPYLLERYPIPGRDEMILKYTSKRSDMDVLISFVALDEAWLKEIMSHRVIDLMDKLGVDKDEVLQHPMISSSLLKAQAKLGKKVRRDLPFDSLEEWLDANVTGTRNT